MSLSVPWLPEVDALLLCASPRAQNGDKGLRAYAGEAVVMHTYARLLEQSCPISKTYVSSNGQHDRYRALGFLPLADNYADWPGALAAIEAALSVSEAECLLVLPCDMGELPLDAIAKLWRPLALSDAAYTYAVCEGSALSGVCLLTHRLLPRLRRRLQAARVDLVDWLQEPGGVAVPFSDGAAFCPLGTTANSFA
jgi:molybdopterin-guanine dinucleotide biosynthesis protein A